MEILQTVARLAAEGTDRLDLKIANAALKEMAEGFEVFAPYRHVRKVTMFGSARTLPTDPLYSQARDLAGPARRPRLVHGDRRRSRHHGRRAGRGRPGSRLRHQHPPAVRTGGQCLHRRGPEAGLDEVLLHPQAAADQGVVRLRRAAGRLRHPRRGVRAADPDPDRQGRAGASRAARRPRRRLLEGLGAVRHRRGGVPQPDQRRRRRLYRIVDRVEEAAAEILGFYRNYHSLRWVGRHAGDPPGGPADRSRGRGAVGSVRRLPSRGPSACWTAPSGRAAQRGLPRPAPRRRCASTGCPTPACAC